MASGAVLRIELRPCAIASALPVNGDCAPSYSFSTPKFTYVVCRKRRAIMLFGMRPGPHSSRVIHSGCQ